MYPPKYFQTSVEENHKLCSLINENPLATLLVSIDEPMPHISHIPFHFAEHSDYVEANSEVLIAHVSNQHPLAKKLLTQENVQVSLVFHGEESYISPHCHDDTNDKRSGQTVPTWNYAKVHVTGIASPINGSEQKYQQMKISSQHFEREQEKPWKMPEMSDKRIQQMLTVITFFKVRIKTFEGRFKLSQNKTEQVKGRIVEQLIQKGRTTLAKQMVK